MRSIVASLLIAAVLSRSPAPVKLGSLFSDHMVLQRGMAVPIWGTAEPGETVTVSIAGQSKGTTADSNGRWSIKLDPLQAGGPHELTVNTIVLKDVLIGEVWVCSGQSNMQWALHGSASADEIAAANWPRIRGFTVRPSSSDEPKSDMVGQWQACAPATAPGFSAVGFYFGREIHQALGVPVGLIFSSWGGTAIECWMSPSALRQDSETNAQLDRWHQYVKDYPRLKEEYDRAKENPDPTKPKLKRPSNPKYAPPHVASLYNGMIAPILPFGIGGVLWYQGESNVGRAEAYRVRFPAMIADWRRNWGQGDFSFLFVQLANFGRKLPEPADSAWARLQEAQLAGLAQPKTGMAVAVDIGDEKDIHPRNKLDVGRRLSKAALSIAYGKDLVHSGPLYDSMKIENDAIRLSFKHAGGGLCFKGDKPAGFAIAGEDRKFVWADARIDGKTLVVASPRVPRPIAVRYAWADTPDVSLYNQEGLPASPFRTDSW